MSELLQQLLSPLDMPRQAAWNAVRAGGNALTGNGTWDDALRAVPGVLGAGLAGGLMATGVGAPLGILAGSLLGGVGQGLGKAVDNERFTAPDVSDLTGTDEFLPNALVGALTDPLSYAGAGLGAKAGRGVFGRLGPQYAGGLEKLAEASKAGGTAAELAAELAASPVSSKLLAEIPPGSKFLAGGTEALPFRTPSGDVVRIAGGEGGLPMARADVPEMLRPTRNVAIGDYRVERVPFAERVGDPNLSGQARRLADRAAESGWHPGDVHPGNVGQVGDKPVFIDPGALIPHDPNNLLNAPLQTPPVIPDMLGDTPWKYLLPGLAGGASVPQLRRGN